MPALPAANKVVRVAIEARLNARPVVNVVHVKYDGAGAGASDFDTLVAGVGQNFADIFKDAQSADLVYVQAVGTDLTSDTALQATLPLTGSGTHAGGAAPASMACCISWHIARRYRGGKPRTYLGGLPISAIDTEDTFSAAFIALVRSDAVDYSGTIDGLTPGVYGSLSLGSVSYYHGFTNVTLPSGRQTSRPTPRGVPIFDRFTGSTVDARIDSQRRRLG